MSMQDVYDSGGANTLAEVQAALRDLLGSIA